MLTARPVGPQPRAAILASRVKAPSAEPIGAHKAYMSAQISRGNATHLWDVDMPVARFSFR